jgi:hypothetical protein
VIKSQLRDGSDELPFSTSDIDSICLMCYNWGVTLVELSQYDLAEKFACKALSFTKFVSSNVSKLKETIQVQCKLRSDHVISSRMHIFIFSKQRSNKKEKI